MPLSKFSFISSDFSLSDLLSLFFRKEATKEKSTKESKPKTSKKKQESDDEEDDDDVVWFTDTSEEATRKRREEMMPKALDEKSKEAEVEEYTKAIKEGPLDKVFDKFKQLKIDQSLNDDEFLDRIFSSIFGNSTDLLSDTKAHHIILKNVRFFFYFFLKNYYKFNIKY